MKIYPTIKSIPELQNTSMSEARQIYRQCYFASFKSWRGWVGVLTLVIMVGIPLWFLKFNLAHLMAEAQILYRGLELLVVISAGFVYSQIVAVNVRYCLQKTVRNGSLAEAGN